MKKGILFILFFIFFFKLNAQQELVSINDPGSPESSLNLEQLIEDVLVSGGCSGGVSNFSSQVGGVLTDLVDKSYGYFSNGTAIGFPFEEGIVITTGKASEGGNIYVPNPPAPRVFPDNNIGIPGDADIENVLGINNTNDATFVKFNFVPTSDTINFRFIMASEEYDGDTECRFTDGFAFLLREVGAANYTNIAVLPDGTPVSVRTINDAPGCAANAEFFAGYEIRDTNYGGRTVVLNATSAVTSGTNYEIKLVIADQGDANKDSAIFLEAGSFDLGGDLGEDITIANGTAVCTGQQVTLNTQALMVAHKWFLDGVEIQGQTGQTLNVTTPGTYSVEINFSANCSVNDSVVVEFRPIEDASFSLTPTCDGATATITGNTGGVFSFNPVATDGATIDPVSGTVTNGVNGTTYTIQYATSGACSDTKTDTVTVSSSGDATFTATATCDGGTAIITGDAGGTFEFDPLPTDGAIIDPVTGTVTQGVSGTTYTIKYSTPGVCGASTSQDITVLDSGNTSFTIDPNCDGGVVTITGDTGGTFEFDPVPTDGAVINPNTGQVTQGVSGATYTIRYTISGACGSTTAQDMTLLSGDSSFILTPTCDGATANITGVLGGVFVFFDPIPTDGATIDADTGEVTGAVFGTTYTVEYGTGAECGPMSIQTFTPLGSSDASFTTNASCDGGSVTITGDVGGVFTFDPLPTDGAVIDATSGAVTGGVSGTTYTIRYAISGVCGSTTTQNMTILNSGNATFTTTPSCDGGTVNITGDAGGAFTFDPVPTDGAVIDATSGIVTGGVSGTTYTIRYTTFGACAATTTQNVVVLPIEDSSFTMLETCDGGTAFIAGAPGGTFVFNPIPTDGAIIDPVTGTVVGLSGVTYTVDYTTSGSCPSTSTQNVTVLDAQDPSFTTNPTCDGGTVTITGDNGGVFSFNPVPGDGAIINPTTGTVTNGISGETYTIQYATGGACPKSLTQNVTVFDVPVIITPQPLISCDEETPGDSAIFDLESKNEEISEGNPDYLITYHETLADADLGINTIVSPYVSITRTVFVRAENMTSVCYATTELDLQVEQSPTTTSVVYALCDDTMEFDGNPANDSVLFDLESQDVVVLNGQDPGTNTVSYYGNQADAEAEINALTSPYENITNPEVLIIRVNSTSSNCFALGELTLEVNPLPSFDLADNYTFCIDADGSEVTPPPVIDTGLNTMDFSFEWYLNGVLIAGATDASYVPAETGSYNVIVTNTITGCSTNIDDPNTITEVNEGARPLLTANQVSLAFVNANSILATATSIAPLTNGNSAYEFSLDGGTWVSKTPNDGRYTFENVGAGEHIVQARDINGCGIASVTVTVLDYPLYFTPNGDGYHETWNIIGIANQPDAVIYIFDRYGKLIKQISPIGLGWDGTFNGQLMPTDDYWFKLEYNEPNTGERKEFNSHFSLKR